MLWVTLFHKIGKQQLKFTQHNHVYALLENPKTHEVEKVYLNLKYDASGHPYFIRDSKDGLDGKKTSDGKRSGRPKKHSNHKENNYGAYGRGENHR